ncbi:MAG: hypothetical protein Q8J88_17935 [Bacteroidales bacterium]|nr:hypothetical protein [Bacteroidales bacterium]
MKKPIAASLILVITFIFILAGKFAIGQSTEQSIVAIKVLDIESFQPISHVNVKLTNTQFGNSTDKNGFCEISILKLPINLTLSHVAFEPKSLDIEEIPPNDTIFVLMKPRTTLLGEINIQATKIPQRYYEDVSIIDFELYDSNLLILEKIRSNPGIFRITLTDLNLEQKSFYSLPLTLKPEKLYKDCLQQCHVISKDSAFQIVNDSSRIVLPFSMELNKFYQNMNGCLFQIENEVYFKEEFNEGYQYNFFYVNAIEKSVHEFKSDFDQKLLNKMNESIRWTRKNPGGTANVSMYFDKYYLFSPFPQVLMKKRDSLVYFNHQHGIIEIYSDIETCDRTIEIEYQKSKKWKREILKDEMTEIFYTFLGTDLFEIDLKSGTVIFKIALGNVHKIVIYNQCAYLLKTKYLSNGKSFRYIEKVRL